jgi:anti-sigma B factor antagonist
MNIQPTDSTLVISEIRELTAGTSSNVKTQVRTRFLPELKNIDFDCTNLDFLDSSGLGALISIQKLATGRGGRFRLLRPKATIVQVLELTRLHRIFEINH